MSNLLQQETAIGIELLSHKIRGAEVALENENPVIKHLFLKTLSEVDFFNVKPLYINPPIITSGLDGSDVLVRSLYLPLKKEKDIDASLPFQAETLLPYSIEEALLARQIIGQNEEGSFLTVLSARKDLLQKHLDKWLELQIEPEKVGCMQSALCQFGKTFLPIHKQYLILHINEKSTNCVLINEGKLISSFSHLEGLDALKSAYNKDSSEIPFDQINFISSLTNYAALSEAFKRLQQALVKIIFSLTKDSKGEPIEGLLLTGESVLWEGFDTKIIEKLSIPLLRVEDNAADQITSLKKQEYAFPIGLAIDAIQNSTDFRQGELSYPYPWKRFQIPLIAYFALAITLAFTLYFFTQSYLDYKEDYIKQDYLTLLSEMNKPYDQFETMFQAKNSFAKEKYQGEVVPIEKLSQDELQERLFFLQKDLQATPDSFPLFANVPRVSDVLAWLSTHPHVNFKTTDGKIEPRLQLENFNYHMIKRPAQGKKQEKYQVKIELEFSSPTPKWAREFHDALITPNDFVDPKGEVKWSSNRGHYRTSFYLKDKTTYPSQ